jgi:hypothetical protein
VLGAWQVLERSLVKIARVVADHALALALALSSHPSLCQVLCTLQQSCQTGCHVNPRKTKTNHCQLIQESPHAT